MTIVRRRVALIAGTMLLAGAASSGVAMASTPTVAHPSVQTNYCDEDWGYWDCGHGGYFDNDHGGYFDHGDHGGYFDHGDHGGYFDHGDHGGY
jgi:hypothetical protein